MSDRYSQLQPPAIVAAIRSMPRRWASALHLAPPKNIEEVFAVAGPDGTSAAEHTGALLSQIATLTDAIRTTSYNTADPLGGEVDAAIEDAGSGPWPHSAADAIADVERLMEALADRLDGLSSSDWGKSADSAAGSHTVTELAQGAVRVAAERLRRVERIVAAHA